MRLIEKDLRTTVGNSSSLETTIDDLKKLIANFYDIKPVNLDLRKKIRTVEFFDRISLYRFLIRRKDQHITVQEAMGNENRGLNEFYIAKDNDHYHIVENNVLSIWFNAWRYEREEKFLYPSHS